jgi:hypothetical protein
MQRPIRAIVYGFLIWWLWFGFYGISLLLPESFVALPSYPTLRLLVLVVLVGFFAVDYLHRIGDGPVSEGLLVGLTWAVLMVANDLGHSLFMEPLDLGQYLTVFAPLYLWIPIVTGFMFWRLRGRGATAG